MCNFYCYKKGYSTEHLGKAIEGTRIRITDQDSKGIGEIEVHSDCMCDGYLNNKNLWDNSITSDGYFKSGDLGKLDEEGNLIYFGRLNESFESGGLIIFPGEIEKIILELDEIEDCVAFGIPDLIFGNLVSIAYIEKRPLPVKEIIKYARKKLPKQNWPAKIFKLKDFPTLSSGKPNREYLRK